VPAILFGSISTVADTSELQRQAFNKAFATHGLPWQWDRDTYLAMLDKSGGRQRIADYADSVGVSVDAEAVHETKSAVFQESLAASPLAARPGVVDTIGAAKRDGLKIALVTTTSPENISAMVEALHPALQAADFDVIVDASSVATSKPDKAAYVFALEQLGEDRDACVAIEDNVDGVRAATAAGLVCVAFPNQNTAGHDFETARRRVDRLDIAELEQLIPTR